MDIQWAQVRPDPELSWHAVEDADGSFCGRALDWSTVVDELPASSSCESCLRIVGRLADV